MKCNKADLIIHIIKALPLKITLLGFKGYYQSLTHQPLYLFNSPSFSMMVKCNRILIGVIISPSFLRASSTSHFLHLFESVWCPSSGLHGGKRWCSKRLQQQAWQEGWSENFWGKSTFKKGICMIRHDAHSHVAKSQTWQKPPSYYIHIILNCKL